MANKQTVEEMIARIIEQELDNVKHRAHRRCSSINNAYKVMRNAGFACEEPPTMGMPYRQIQKVVDENFISLCHSQRQAHFHENF